MPTSFTLGTSTNNKETAIYAASSTLLSSGNVVVTYYVNDNTGANLANGMFYQVYDPQMVAITGPLPVVVDPAAQGKSNGIVVPTDDGGFVIMQKFDATGNATQI